MIAAPDDDRSDRVRSNWMTARRMGIDTYQEPVIYMRSDCAVCQSEGFESRSRVKISGNGRELIATLNVVDTSLLADMEAGLSDAAWGLLGAAEPCGIEISHPEPVESFRFVRGKLFGQVLERVEIGEVVADIANRRYSDVQISAFLAAGVGDRLNQNEMVSLTRAMVDAGQVLDWPDGPVFDKHCVGGLPGNRTTPLVVSIVAAAGLVIPKTSSRAITSPAGTADTMATLTRVELSLPEMRRVVEREGGCLVWGGTVNLSPADDLLIRVERALDLDSEAQLVASVLSKKAAAGSTRVLIDMPVGPTAKIRDAEAASRLSRSLTGVGSALGLSVRTLVTDGTQPVGRGIGPALEARDVLAALRGDPGAPQDLILRAATLAGVLLEMSEVCSPGQGFGSALETLREGRAWAKFVAICEAQGGIRTPPVAPHTVQAVAQREGQVSGVDNRRLAKLAKLAGAPKAPAAGVELLVHLGERVVVNQPVLVIHSETRGELDYALQFLKLHPGLLSIRGPE